MTTPSKPLVLRFTVPYPPPPLLPNARAHWSAKQKHGRDYATMAGAAIVVWLQRAGHVKPGQKWPSGFQHGRLATTHHFTRQAADPDNCVGALKPLIDVLQVATKASGARYRLGIIENDRNLEVLPPERRAFSPCGKSIDCVLEVW